jgi:uncharacterized protein YndB with AHSA1/START domain
METTTTTSQDTAERELTITRIFNAPRSLVYRAWTEPEHLAKWLGGPGATATGLESELRVGGAYRIHMRFPDGTDHWVRGVYREIIEQERLVYTWAWENTAGMPRHETIVTVTFEDAGGDTRKTRMTLHHAGFESITARDEHRRGWIGSYDRFAELLATVR